MRTYCFLYLAFLSFAVLLCESLHAQNIRNDTLYVNTGSAVEVIFNAPSGGTLPVGDGSYEVTGGTNTSLLIRALKKGAKDQPLIVNEGPREHKFILSYKEEAPPKRIDWSDLKKLEAHVKEKEGVSTITNPATTNSVNLNVVKKNKKQREEETKILNEADDLFKKELWEEAEVKYRQLSSFSDIQKATLVNNRLADIEKHILEIKQKQYTNAIKTANSLAASQKFEEAKNAYSKALEFKPNDKDALNGLKQMDIRITDKKFNDYVVKGEQADVTKNYEVAKTNYEAALKIKLDQVFLQKKLAAVTKKLNSKVYQQERDKGDYAFKTNDLEGARKAYAAALVTKPNDEYLKSQLKKIDQRQEMLENNNKKEAEYTGLLNKAKSLSENTSLQNLSLAIEEYKKAAKLFPDRRFPVDQIKRLGKTLDSLNTQPTKLKEKTSQRVTFPQNKTTNIKYNKALLNKDVNIVSIKYLYLDIENKFDLTRVLIKVRPQFTFKEDIPLFVKKQKVTFLELI